MALRAILRTTCTGRLFVCESKFLACDTLSNQRLIKVSMFFSQAFIVLYAGKELPAPTKIVVDSTYGCLLSLSFIFWAIRSFDIEIRFGTVVLR
jgi:hypothetical protein